MPAEEPQVQPIKAGASDSMSSDSPDGDTYHPIHQALPTNTVSVVVTERPDNDVDRLIVGVEPAQNANNRTPVGVLPEESLGRPNLKPHSTQGDPGYMSTVEIEYLATSTRYSDSRSSETRPADGGAHPTLQAPLLSLPSIVPTVDTMAVEGGSGIRAMAASTQSNIDSESTRMPPGDITNDSTPTEQHKFRGEHRDSSSGDTSSSSSSTPRQSSNFNAFYSHTPPNPHRSSYAGVEGVGSNDLTRQGPTRNSETENSMPRPRLPQPYQPSFGFPPGFVPFADPTPVPPFIPPVSTPVPPFIPPVSTPVTPFIPPISPPVTPFIPPVPMPGTPWGSSPLLPARHVRYAPVVEQYTMSPVPTDPRPNSSVYSTLILEGHEWRQYIHPNGSLYWNCPAQRVVSDKHPQLDTIASHQPLLQSLPPNEFMVYLADNSSHFVHHASRSISSYRQTFPEFHLQIQQSLFNIQTRCELEAPYWTFVQSHPHDVILSEDNKREAEEALLWCYADRRLFESSTAPFEKEAAREMLAILRQVSALSRPTLKVWFIAAIMRSVVQERSASHYGTLNARNYRQLEKADELPEFERLSSSWRVVLWTVLASLAFGAPFGYLKRVINVNRSSGISTSRWQAFLKNLCAEWAGSNLLSVVLVSGTVGMLSVPGLNAVARIAAFHSILCALSAVLTGTLLISYHRGRIESTGRTAFLYFNYAKRTTGSHHVLAILLSLPLALTLWGVAWFVVSVVSSAYRPGVPGIPHTLEIVLRFTSISVVCALAVVVTTVPWFFRTQHNSGTVENKREAVSPVPQYSDPLPFNWHQPTFPSPPNWQQPIFRSLSNWQQPTVPSSFNWEATPPNVMTYHN